MHPLDLFGPEFRVRLIHLHPLYVHGLDYLAMMKLGPMGCHLLKPMHGLECHPTDIGGALITDAPSLTFQQSYARIFGELTAGHQGALPLGELLVTCCAAQPFDMLVGACPGPMRDVAFARLIEPHTVDSGMRIVYSCPELALSVSLWSSCGKEWTERYRCDASFSTLLFSRTTQRPVRDLLRKRAHLVEQQTANVLSVQNII